MRKIDRIIKNSLEDTPNLDRRINKNLAESYAESNYQQAHNEDEDVSVFTVEQYKRPKFARRMGAFAAAVTVCAAVGGSVVMMNGLREVPEAPLTSDVIEEPEDSSEEITDEIIDEPVEDEGEEYNAEISDEEDTPVYESAENYPENSYDMTTQEGIVAKMLNSVDFYDKAAGKFSQIYCPGDVLGMATTYDFEYDLTTGEQHVYNDTVVCLNSYDDIIAGELPNGYKAGKAGEGFDVYCDGEKAFCVNINDVEGTYNEYSGFERWVNSGIGSRDEGEVNLAQILDKWDENSYLQIWQSDMQTFGNIKIKRRGIALEYNYLNPYHRILKALLDFDTWSFEPTTFLDREAVSIEGNIPQTNYDDWGGEFSGNYFQIVVDVETGMMLKYVEYRESDNTIYDFMVMNELRFNEDVGEIPMVDIDDYRKFTEDDYKTSTSEFYTNSKGETYGGTSYNIMPSNSDKLPDLIDFGTGYMKKEEIFETIGDFDSNTLDLRQEFNKKDDDVLIYSMNLYDVEGEIIVGTVNYYGSEQRRYNLIGY